MTKDLYKTPRLYTAQTLQEGAPVTLEGDQHHYLVHVMRLENGSPLRIFNEKDGEFYAEIINSSKKSLEIAIKSPIPTKIADKKRTHLFIPPLRKEKMDFLVEKSVELGVTDLHPVITHNTDWRKINEDRIKAQIIEATEQCERCDLATLHPVTDLTSALKMWDASQPLFAALERSDAAPLSALRPAPDQDCGLLIGPPGGFTAEEVALITRYGFVRGVTLGPRILRAETAAIAGLALLNL